MKIKCTIELEKKVEWLPFARWSYLTHNVYCENKRYIQYIEYWIHKISRKYDDLLNWELRSKLELSLSAENMAKKQEEIVFMLKCQWFRLSWYKVSGFWDRYVTEVYSKYIFTWSDNFTKQ